MRGTRSRLCVPGPRPPTGYARAGCKWAVGANVCERCFYRLCVSLRGYEFGWSATYYA